MINPDFPVRWYASPTGNIGIAGRLRATHTRIHTHSPSQTTAQQDPLQPDQRHDNPIWMITRETACLEENNLTQAAEKHWCAELCG